jgi:UDP-N-acetylmuramoyl-tripeptide--D-alanyl-D-alanine ligase
MSLWTLHALQTALDLPVEGPDVHITGVQTDSRQVQPGDLFIALAGTAHDGHDFVTEAVKAGAAALLVSRSMEVPVPQLVVAQTDEGLVALARAARARFKGPVIAVTGSAGKTTTKDFLREGLCAHGPEMSLNNHVGVPLTLARLPQEAAAAVVEIGMNAPGEIAPLAELAKPTVALVTNVFPVHVGAFEGVEGIRQEKLSLTRGLLPQGTLVVPAGLSLEGCGWHGQVRQFDPAAPLQIKIADATPARVACAQAALAAATAAGLEMGDISHLSPLPGRGCVEDVQGVTVVDDSYNANPASVKAALQALQTRPGRRYFAVLGDMLELGADGPQYHAGLAPLCEVLDGVLCVGELMHHLYDALPRQDKFCHVSVPLGQPAGEAAQEALTRLGQQAQVGDVILVKGSNGNFWQGKVAQRLTDALKKRKAC